MGSGDPSSRLVCPTVTCHCPGAHGCCPCYQYPPGLPAQAQRLLRCISSQIDLMLLEEAAQGPLSSPEVSFGGGTRCFSTCRVLQPPVTGRGWPWRLAIAGKTWRTGICRQRCLQLGMEKMQEQTAAAPRHLCTPSRAELACAQREVAKGFNAAGRGKGCREVGPSWQLSWSIPGAQAGLRLTAGAGTGPAAIQLTTVLSHRVKSRLSEAIDRMRGRG